MELQGRATISRVPQMSQQSATENIILKCHLQSFLMYCCGNLDFYVNLLRNFVIVPSKGIVLLEKKEDSNGLQFAV